MQGVTVDQTNTLLQTLDKNVFREYLVSFHSNMLFLLFFIKIYLQLKFAIFFTVL